MSQRTAGKAAKALYSAAIAFLGGLAAILTGKLGFGDVTAGQWVTLTLSALLAGGGTFGLSGWAGPTTGPLVNGRTGDH